MTHEQMIDEFCRWIPQLPRESARKFLESFNWDYKACTDWYWREYILIY